MKIKKLCLVIFCLSLQAPGIAAGLLDDTRLTGTATASLRSGDYVKALSELKKDTAVIDTGFYFFKLGCVYSGLKDWTNALFFLKAGAEKDARYASFAYEKIGDVSLAQGRFENALNACRLAANLTKMGMYGDALYAKMRRIIKEHSQELGPISWMDGFQDTPKVAPPVLADTILSLLRDTLYKTLDSLILQRLDGSVSDNRLCSVCTRIPLDSTHDSLFSTRTLFIVSKTAYTCKLYRQAFSLLEKASTRPVFEDAIVRQNYILLRAQLSFKLERYAEAVSWGEKYHKRYSPEASVLYLIARSYRNLGDAEKAELWYKKHVEHFPHLEKSAEIVWVLAWQKEEIGALSEARKLFKKLFASRRTDKSKAEPAWYRYALTYCKERNYSSALETFNDFTKKYPLSEFVPGARFWKARCYFSMGQHEKARKECALVCNAVSSDYYAYRSRELLMLMGDSAQGLSIDTTFSPDRTYAWMDSMSGPAKKILSPEDSVAFLLGTSLAGIGMMNYVSYLLKPLEDAYSDNFLVQYELSRLYTICNDPAGAFRIARRMGWRIASNQTLPSSYYTLLYPGFYTQYILPAAKNNAVDPEFISAIIRQESIFNARIVSPAGAIGLMQIMPYTGQEIAADLKEPFYNDSLYSPAVSIRYGTHYIRKQLNQFNGNMVLAIAAYNGGPHNAKKWLALNSDDGFDMFVEDISFSETCKYVKKVLGNYWTYKELSKKNMYPKQ
jgi:soluble lytic murein transglycosylase-like protein/TolA-binding protein